MSEVVIRRAQRSDLAEVLRFHHALYVAHRDAIMPPERGEFYAYRRFSEALRDDVDALLRSPRAIVLLAVRASDAVGYITGHHEDDDERRVLRRKGIVEDWYVTLDARGAGLGARLLEVFADEFRRVGCEVIESATWPFNDGARRAHEALGFHEIEIKYRRRL
jgi:GNAT superfamily N-acetyltransferase